MSNDAGLSYRQSAIEGASPLGLVIVLYDTLWGDLRRAAEALRRDDIEARCRELNHGFLVLEQLEGWLAPEHGDPLAGSLTQFYRYLRASMMQASATRCAKTLEDCMELILHVRSAWQQRDMAPIPAAQPSTSREPQTIHPLAEDPHRIALSFSA